MCYTHMYFHEANNQRFWTKPEVYREHHGHSDKRSGSFWKPTQAFDHLADCPLKTLFAGIIQGESRNTYIDVKLGT